MVLLDGSDTHVVGEVARGPATVLDVNGFVSRYRRARLAHTEDPETAPVRIEAGASWWAIAYAIARGGGDEPSGIGGPLLPELRQHLSQLDDREREVLTLRVAVGLALDDVAECLGCSPADVRLVQHVALERLRSQV